MERMSQTHSFKLGFSPSLPFISRGSTPYTPSSVSPLQKKKKKKKLSLDGLCVVYDRAIFISTPAPEVLNINLT